MNKKQKLLLGLALAFFAIQFIRPAKNLAPGPAGQNDLLVRHPAPPEVKRLLEVGCYDCHSNQTRYPWYVAVQPVASWLAHHVAEGKDHLNFSEFGAYSVRTQAKKLDALVDEVETRGMPLKSYTWTHRDAVFTDAQIKALVAWAEALHEKLAPEEAK